LRGIWFSEVPLMPSLDLPDEARHLPERLSCYDEAHAVVGAPTTREPKREGGNNNSKASIGDAGQPECWIQDRDGDVAS
jgi:hypothetical protein